MNEQVKKMVDRFLGWMLPKNFHPDAGISFKPEYNVEYMAKQGKPPLVHEPVGTNLFDADQAREMVEFISADVLAELTTLRQQVEQLSAEVHHWKSNHDNRVAAARVLIERNDMPLERVQCYQDYLDLQRKVAELQASKARMAEAVGNTTLWLRRVLFSLPILSYPQEAVIALEGAEKLLSTYDPAWLEANRAEAGRKALEKLRKLANEG